MSSRDRFDDRILAEEKEKLFDKIDEFIEGNLEAELSELGDTMTGALTMLDPVEELIKEYTGGD